MFWKLIIFKWTKSNAGKIKNNLVDGNEKNGKREKSMKISCKVSISGVKCLINKACLPYPAKLYYLK